MARRKSLGVDAATQIAAVALLALLQVGCGGDPQTPEAQLRGWLAAAEREAEARDLGGLTERVSERYADSRGNDRGAIRGILIHHFLRNQAVHLLTHVERAEISTSEPDRAEVVVYVAMAGAPMQRPEDLARIRGSLYRFELTLVDEGGGSGEWRLREAQWRRATAQDTGIF